MKQVLQTTAKVNITGRSGGVLELINRIVESKELIGTNYQRMMLKIVLKYDGNNFITLGKSIFFRPDNGLRAELIFERVDDLLDKYKVKYEITSDEVTIIATVYGLSDKFVPLYVIGETGNENDDLVKDFGYLSKYEFEYLNSGEWDNLGFIGNNEVGYSLTRISKGFEVKITLGDVEIVCIDKIEGDRIMREYKDLILCYDKETKGVFITGEYKFKSIPKKKKDLMIQNKYITLDIETYLVNGVHTPYAIGYYSFNKLRNRENFKYYYIKDYKTTEIMINKLIEDLFKVFNRYIVYTHNLGRYDAIFILKSIDLAKYKVTLIDQNNAYIYIKVEEIMTNKVIHFHDSFKLLPESLASLCKGFDIGLQKTYFPYSFVTTERLDYVGEFPAIEYFENMTEEVYVKLKNEYGHFDMREYAVKYLKNDVKSLYLIIESFSKLVFAKYSLNVTKFISISSLSLNLFLTYFYKGNIPLVTGLTKKIVRKAYIGGIVDIYKPYGQNLVCYDVNSLYPFAMTNNKYPIGNANFTLNQDLDSIFGFVYAYVEMDQYIHIPVLPLRSGKNIFNPIGTWTGWYFSEELKEAVRKGYKVRVIHAIEFKEGIGLFDEFVNHFYEIKLNGISIYKKLAKLILNTFYGRFGLSIESKRYVLTTVQRDDVITNIVDLELLTPDKVVVSIEDGQPENEMLSSLPIAAAVTSYARMYMNKFKDNSLYYTDTDSLFMDKELPSSLVGLEIGKFKMVDKIKEGVFPQYKFYGYTRENNTNVIKSKGVESGVTMEMLKNLLKVNEREATTFSSDMFKVDKRELNIITKSRTYTIGLNEVFYKRELIINKDQTWVDTKPLVVKDGEITGEGSNPSYPQYITQACLISTRGFINYGW